MKKLTKILLIIWVISVIPIICSAQIQQDKYYHAGAGVVGTQAIFSLVNYDTKDYKLAFRASAAAITVVAFSKEMHDGVQKQNFSFSDLGVTLAFGYVTAVINRQIQKRKYKKQKIEYNEWNFNPPLATK